MLWPGMGLAWDGGGLRPIEDAHGFDALQRELGEACPPAMLLRGKHGRWMVARRQPPIPWQPLWLRSRAFAGPMGAWPEDEKRAFFWLAQTGMINFKFKQGGTNDE